jgi:hypothetical protein
MSTATIAVRVLYIMKFLFLNSTDHTQRMTRLKWTKDNNKAPTLNERPYVYLKISTQLE